MAAFTEVDLTGDHPLTVHDIVRAIDETFPFDDAAPWDRVGLLVGDGNAQVSGVLVTLDAGLNAIARAQELGANVIVTHHPIHIETPEHFNITHTAYTYPARVIHAAIAAGVAIIAAHTNLDKAPAARRHWGEALEMKHVGPLPPLDPAAGFPRVRTAVVPSDDANMCDPAIDEDIYGELWQVRDPRSLNTLAAEIANLTGRCVRAYGDGETIVSSVVTATGSASSRIPEALFAKADVIVAGEFRYHDALAAVESGLCLLELGHDISELPLLDLLAECVHVRTSIADDALQLDREPNLWNCVATGSIPPGQL